MHSSPNRDQIIRSLFETMDNAKRGMYAHLQAINRTLPIPRAQLELLTAIKHLQPISFKALAHYLYLTPGAISQLADGLAEQKLIERQIDTNDRRIQCLNVTKKGNKLLQDVDKRKRRIMESVFRELSDEELALWAQVQQKLVDTFQAEIVSTTKEQK